MELDEEIKAKETSGNDYNKSDIKISEKYIENNNECEIAITKDNPKKNTNIISVLVFQIIVVVLIGSILIMDIDILYKLIIGLMILFIDAIFSSISVIKYIIDSRNYKMKMGRNQTIELDEKSVKIYGYLLIEKGGRVQRYKIKNREMIIGRTQGKVDILTENISVGKVHCKILKEGNQYYIIDLDSKNGTYINGNRINPKEKSEIKHRDIIRLSTEEFLFVIE